MPEPTILLIEGPIEIRRGGALQPEFIATIGGRPIASVIGAELLRDEAPGTTIEIPAGVLTIGRVEPEDDEDDPDLRTYANTPSGDPVDDPEPCDECGIEAAEKGGLCPGCAHVRETARRDRLEAAQALRRAAR